MEEGFKSLKVWQKAYEFALGIYRMTKMFPREELYGLTNTNTLSKASLRGVKRRSNLLFMR